MSPLDVVDLVDKAGLRDRGGTWKALAPRWRELAGRTEYLCVNANESSPGAFRDRKLIERHPHQFIEGVAIAAYALEVRQVYICMRPEMKRGIQLLKSALQEVRASGILDMATTDIEATLEIVVHVGGGAYIAGEETALLASLEGQRAEPKAQPPRLAMGFMGASGHRGKCRHTMLSPPYCRAWGRLVCFAGGRYLFRHAGILH